MADSTQLHQVVMNLAVNARDAMPQGGRLTLTTANRSLPVAEQPGPVDVRAGEFVELTVADTGEGMSAEVLPRIFEPFYTTKPVGQGTGLGLAVVYGIVKAHGGWITVDTDPGQGSVFRVGLPAEAPVPDAVGPPAETPRPDSVPRTPAGGGAGPAGVVMVVDDEDLIRNLARSILERAGYRVYLAADGEKALALYREHGREIGVVLLDYTMPRLTGLQVLRGLRQLDPDVRVIFSSGFSSDQDSQQLLAAGARGFVPKPYRPQDLVRVVQDILQDKAGSVP
jgi:CheY-like chemotaxis protein